MTKFIIIDNFAATIMKTAQIKLTTLVMLTLLYFVGRVTAQTYCIPTSITTSDQNLLSQLTINGNSVSIPAENQGYTASVATPVATVTAGNNLSISVAGSMPGFTSLVSAFIDINNDSTFEREAPERTTLFTRTPNTSSTTYPFSTTVNVPIPSSTASGQYRLRILSYNGIITNPCVGSARIKCIHFNRIAIQN